MFKKLRLSFFITMLLLLLTMPLSSLAHPGRTDSNGGHTCRTNCEKWGLEYGEYHYHNRNKSSGGGGGSTNASSPQVNEQQLEEQRQKEELAKQQAAEEEEKRKQEEVARQKMQKEKESGHQEGAIKASEDFEKGEQDQESHLAGKTTYYSDAFKESYTEVWNEKQDQKNYYQKGYDQGLGQEKLNLNEIPQNRVAIFEEGFNKGNSERIELIKEEQYDLGKKQGLKKEEKQPTNSDREEYVKAYNKGYKTGMKKTIMKEGKASAKKNYSAKVPKEYKDNKDYTKWYKQGFNSDKKAKEVRKAGFAKGKKFFSTSRVPKEYKNYSKLYKKSYKKGKAA